MATLGLILRQEMEVKALCIDAGTYILGRPKPYQVTSLLLELEQHLLRSCRAEPNMTGLLTHGPRLDIWKHACR